MLQQGEPRAEDGLLVKTEVTPEPIRPRDVWLWHIDKDGRRHALRLRFAHEGGCEVVSWPALLWDRGQWPGAANYESTPGVAWTWTQAGPVSVG